MASVCQEFYCNDCDHFFLVKLSVGYDRPIVMTCPKCEREHRRGVVNGKIVESHGMSGTPEQIIVPKSASSKKPFSAGMKKGARDGVPLDKEDMAARDAQLAADAMKREIWLERYGARAT